MRKLSMALASVILLAFLLGGCGSSTIVTFDGDQGGMAQTARTSITIGRSLHSLDLAHLWGEAKGALGMEDNEPTLVRLSLWWDSSGLVTSLVVTIRTGSGDEVVMAAPSERGRSEKTLTVDLFKARAESEDGVGGGAEVDRIFETFRGTRLQELAYRFVADVDVGQEVALDLDSEWFSAGAKGLTVGQVAGPTSQIFLLTPTSTDDLNAGMQAGDLGESSGFRMSLWAVEADEQPSSSASLSGRGYEGRGLRVPAYFVVK
jgi:uncharacterized protein YcfL